MVCLTKPPQVSYTLPTGLHDKAMAGTCSCLGKRLWVKYMVPASTDSRTQQGIMGKLAVKMVMEGNLYSNCDRMKSSAPNPQQPMERMIGNVYSRLHEKNFQSPSATPLVILF